jgi:aminopeptidase N
MNMRSISKNMSFIKLRGLAFASVAIVVFSVFASAQTARPNLNRERTYDVQNYIIHVSFNRPEKRIFGDTTVQLKPLNHGFTQAELDAVDLKFDSVKLDPQGTDIKYRTSGEHVIVTLDRAYSPDELISIRFKYSAQPKKGVYFVDEFKPTATTTLAPQIWSQGEAEENRHWFPSFDSPNDKATSEEFITAQSGESVIGNGELIDKKENGDGTVTFHFRMTVPYSSYLTSFVVGQYSRVEDSYKDIPLGFYVYPGREPLAKQAFGNTKRMIQAFEELTGIDFPYKKYDQTVVRNFQFGGMENITATTFADTEIFFVNFDFGKATVEDLVSHELAHSWFGDLVTCRNWSELWLNESFATYMEAMSREKLWGHDSYIRKIRSDAGQAIADDASIGKRHALFNVSANPKTEALYDTITYQKGGTVLHMLHETIGDAAFWKAVNNYLNQHKFDNVETPDLQKAMEEASGQDLKWFFDQWVYGAGVPKLDVKQSYSPGSRTLKITVNQTQKLEPGIPEAFILPMSVEIKAANGVRTEKLDIRKRSQVFSFKTDGPPTHLTFDKEEKLPLATLKLASLVTTK